MVKDQQFIMKQPVKQVHSDAKKDNMYKKLVYTRTADG